jgi:hypothetical protein
LLTNLWCSWRRLLYIVTVGISLTENSFIPVNKNILFCICIRKEKDMLPLIIEENLLIIIYYSNKPPLWRRSLTFQIWLRFVFTETKEQCCVLTVEAI